MNSVIKQLDVILDDIEQSIVLSRDPQLTLHLNTASRFDPMTQQVRPLKRQDRVIQYTSPRFRTSLSFFEVD